MNYSYTRTTDLFGNFTGTITPRVGVTLADYTPGSGFTGTSARRRVAYNVPTFIPNAAEVAAGGNGFLTTNVPGYYDRLPRPRGGAEQAAVEPVDGPRRLLVEQRARALRSDAAGIYDTNGNPTPTRDRAAGERRPVRAAERRQRRGHDLHQREVAVQRERAVPGAATASS